MVQKIAHNGEFVICKWAQEGTDSCKWMNREENGK
jgi:hypothetical protein